ncbi:MAG TPA: ABC transporter ATP-binding protein [Polyangiales bacterium]|jgi:branched-chain amino acid transport system ATP-binding protein|nr:ABC transporter ATP-binding protein [Polyangiales bacterium]
MDALLQVEDLHVSYGDAVALNGVSLEVGEKAVVALVGTNGAGKTSLLRAIAGINPARSGRVRYRGRDLAQLAPHTICNLGIGQVAEGRQLFPSLTVQDNLELGGMLPRARDRIRQSLTEVFDMFPRLADRRRQLAGTMSGGEQQMLAIGRCLMGRPELIMFDEPSLGLAPAMVQEVFRTIVSLNQRGVTVLLVEQNVALSLKVASDAYVLENGQMVLRGKAERLLTDPRVREAYLGL